MLSQNTTALLYDGIITRSKLYERLTESLLNSSVTGAEVTLGVIILLFVECTLCINRTSNIH